MHRILAGIESMLLVSIIVLFNQYSSYVKHILYFRALTCLRELTIIEKSRTREYFEKRKMQQPRSQTDSADNRSYDELRRDVELGLDTLRQSIKRTKQSGPDGDQNNWAISRVRSTLEKMRRSRDGDSIVTNRLIAECGRLENDLRNAEKSWLISHPPSTTGRASSGDEDPLLRDPDEERARLLRAQVTLQESDRVIDDIERNVGTSVRVGVNTQQALEEQGETLHEIHSNVTETGASAKAAARVLKKMAERAFYNRLFLWFLIAVLVLANGLFLYYGFIKK